MKISTNWINEYVDIKDLDKKDLADKITNAGVNIENIKEHNFNNLVVGQIISCGKHPASDHLNICMVDVNKEKLQIICGADNVREGIKVVVALEGAILPGDFKIERRKLLGVESCGMICALYELGLADKETTYDDGIHILNEDAQVGDFAIKYLNADDTIYTLDLNPNRNDCLSHLGFAYEAASVLNKEITMPEVNHSEIEESIKDNLSLKVETDLCSMYLSKMVRDVKIGPSPDFIKNRLEEVGMRSINNVVDISNYIMLEYGQPLHFFDKEKLGNQIIVREAKENEKIITLDNIERVLTKDDIVITNENGPVAIAGVMGGLNTDIDDSTKNVVIESAIFNPYNVRYTSIRLGLRSEASLRIEKGLNYEYTCDAIKRACYLLEKYASAKVLKDTLVHDKVDKTLKEVEITLDKINSTLGITLEEDVVGGILNQLKFPYKKDGNIFKVTIPNRRMDVSIKEDIIEEVGRLYGYEKLENKKMVLPIKSGTYTKNIGIRKAISKRLRSLNLNEVKTYTLVSEKEKDMFKNGEYLKVLMPMSQDKMYVRKSLIPSLLNVYDYNKKRGIKNINIYEISNVYDEKYNEEVILSMLCSGEYIPANFDKTGIKNDFYVLKGIIENLLNFLGYDKRYRFEPLKDKKELHPGVSANIYIDNDKVGFIGKMSPKLVKDDIYVSEINLSILYGKKTKKIKYPEISKYPDITKDVAFILDKKILTSDVIKEIRKNGTKILNDVTVFDLYESEKLENKRSIAFKLTFNDLEKTLKEEEVDKIFRNVIDAVMTKFKCEIRDK
ncbi:MAG: phenylalanine--tRNA ligase subunit beta [bacterium]|nr:phenylalanine--tRNA ligase subunit beta [bacterium]